MSIPISQFIASPFTLGNHKFVFCICDYYFCFVKKFICTIFWFHMSVSWIQLLSHVRLFATPWTAARKASLSITNSRVHSNSCPLSQWCHPTISSSVVPFSHLRSFPASGYFQMFSSLHQVAKMLKFKLQYQSFQWIFRTDFLYGGLVWSPCSPRDSQESSPFSSVQFSCSVLSDSLQPHEP